MFETFATQDDGPSLIRSVKDSLANQDYAGAVTTCELMEADDADDEEALYVCASAYAGVCGYDLFAVINQITAYNGTTPLIFEYFMTQNHGATLAKVDACNTALTKIRTIGAAADRTGDQNYLALFSAFTNMGVILNLLADATDDDAPDGGFDACLVGSMTNAQATQFGKALWELYRATEVISSAMTEISDLKTALDGVSAAIDLIDPTLNFLLASVNPDSFTANQLRGIRTLIKEGQVLGLNYCADFLTCLCP
ncbi:MAG: hypothetical protein AABZ31_12215 [Bdellovibrionota bacterium]